jgi:plastocyanin
MRGTGSEPVEVWLSDGRPARFVWRGRMHTVLFVRDMRSLVSESDESSEGEEFWLVEATAQRTVPATTYQLWHDLATGRWTLSRG